jgi:hypothetical protein
MENIKQFLNAHSMDIALFISGALGALISDKGKDVQLSSSQRVLRMVFGGITAIYGTLLLVLTVEHLFGLKFPSETYAGIGFFLGHIGLAGITKIIVKYTERKKK